MFSIDLTRRYRWQPSGKSNYAPRFEGAEWQRHEEDIRSLHAQGRTKNQILDILDRRGFRPSYCQLRTRLKRLQTEASHSQETTTPSSTELEVLSNTLEGCLDSIDSQVQLSDELPEQDSTVSEAEKQVFKKFTTLYDEVDDLDSSLETECHTTTKEQLECDTRKIQQKGKPKTPSSATLSFDGQAPADVPVTLQGHQKQNNGFPITNDLTNYDHSSSSQPYLRPERALSVSSEVSSEELEELASQVHLSLKRQRRLDAVVSGRQSEGKMTKSSHPRMRRRCACGKAFVKNISRSNRRKKCDDCSRKPSVPTQPDTEDSNQRHLLPNLRNQNST